MYYRNCLLLLFLFFFSIVSAQRMPRPDVITARDGLGIRDLRAIAQDSRGLLWIGTTKGIERYDGSRFIQFGSDYPADLFFPGMNVSDENMLFVNDTCLWVLADENLFSLNVRTLQTTNLSEKAGLKGNVFTLRQGADSTIWIATDDGREQQLLRYAGNNRFKTLATAKHLRMPFNDIALDAAGNAWWSTNVEGLRLFSPEGDLLHQAKPDSIIWYGTKIYFTNISTDSRGRLFIFPKSNNAIWLYNPETSQYDVLAENLAARVYTMLEDRRGNFWFATYDGLLRWNSSGEWTDFTATLHNRLPFSQIRHLYEDRTHLLWIVTDNGLLRFPIGTDLFKTHLIVQGQEWGNSMRGIFADPAGRVYAFCENGEQGLHLLGTENDEGRLIYPFDDSRLEVPVLNQADHFMIGKNGKEVWALNNNLLKINMTDWQGTIVDSFPDVLEFFARNPFCLLKDGNILLGTLLENLTIYDPASRRRNRLFPQGLPGIPSTKVEAMLEAENGFIWVGTITGGLFCFNRKGKMLAHFTSKTQPGLGSDYVLSLLFDTTGKLWIGTFGGGLSCLEIPPDPEGFQNLSGFSMRIFTQKEGLSDNNVVSMLEDDFGNIWAATYNGLSCYQVREGTFRNFFEEDGLSNNEFNYASAFKDDEGGLWFGGMNGVNHFHPKEALQARDNPPLCLTGFTKYDSREDTTVTAVIGNGQTERYIISAHDSWFQFSWALPNYFKPDKNNYYVRLEGLEDDWSYIGNTPFVRYNKLPPGKYTLRVKGADSKGNWSSGELSVPITVRPFFYQTWWFYLIVLGIVGGIGFRISRARYQRRLEMEKMRTKIASDLHDEVGSMLSGLSMQAELLELSVPEKERPRLHRISDISHAAVSKMRDLVWSIDSRRDKVKNLLDRMREQATDLLQPLDIQCHFELGDLPLEKKLPVDVRQHLYLIFKEALNNAARHSNATEVTVRFGNFDGQFILSIRDNGSPVKKTTPSTGMGLSNMKMRAEKIGAQLEVIESPGFCIRLRRKSL